MMPNTAPGACSREEMPRVSECGSGGDIMQRCADARGDRDGMVWRPEI